MPLLTLIGMGPGMGDAIARRFAAEGFSLALIARDAAKLATFVENFRQNGYPASAFAADASDSAQIVDAIGAAHREFGRTDVLVYNAAPLTAAKPSELQPDTLIHDFRICVASALVAAQQVLPGMRERGKGTILLTGGGLALHPAANYTSTSIGKAGIRSLAFALAQELGPEGIHAATVTICGFVQPGTRFDPVGIAEQYWRLHRQAPGQFETEQVFA